MPDDIISLYLKPKEGETSKPSAVQASPQNDDIIKKYLKSPSAPTASNKSPSVPISGSGEDESNTKSYPLPEYQSSSLADVGKNAALRTYDAAKQGVLTAASGIGDTFSGKPASGLGKIGTGALQIIGSPTEAVSSVGSDLTGSEDIGNRAGFIAGMVPVIK